MNNFTAYCFGRASSLVIQDEEGSYYSSDAKQGPGWLPCREGEFEWLKEIDPNFSVMTNVGIEEAQSRLSAEAARQNSLFFALASLDANLSPELRLEAAEICDEYLSRNEISEWLRRTTWSKPLPLGATSFTLEAPNFAFWWRFKQELAEIQPALQSIWWALSKLRQSEQLSSSDLDAPGLLDDLLGHGTIPALASAIRSRDVTKFNDAIVTFATDPNILRDHPTASRILAKLRSILQEKNVFGPTVGNLFEVVAERNEQSGEVSENQGSLELSNHQTFVQVRKQIEGIRKLLLGGNRSAVDKAVGELLEFHGHFGEHEHAAKSLCALTTIALEANEPHIADDLSLRALELGVDDVVILTNRAEVLKHLGRLDEAQRAYEQVLERYGKVRYALCGYADVLKDQGAFSAAISTYELARELYPNDPVADNGLVGVYVAQNRLEQALTQAQYATERYDDVVSRVVLGGVLRQMGRYVESSRILAEAARRFPNTSNVWASLIRSYRYADNFDKAFQSCDEYAKRFPDLPGPLLLRGEVLRAQGEFYQSLEWFSKALKKFPGHKPAQIGKASLLVLLNRSEEAAEMLQDLEVESEIDWLAFHALCMAKLRMGHTEEAITALERGRNNAPWSRTRGYFSASLGFAYYKQGRMKQAAIHLSQALQNSDNEKKNVMLVVLGSVHGHSGNSVVGKNLIQTAKPATKAGKSIKSFFQRAAASGFTVQIPAPIEQAAFDSLLAAAA